MKNFLCYIFNHRWEQINDNTKYCVRCKLVKITPVPEYDPGFRVTPAPTQDWYTPKQKERKVSK